MKWNEIGDMPCSVARTLSVIGDRWTMLILRDAFFGLSRFDDLQRRLGVTRHILADRLNALVGHGVLEKKPYRQRPLRHEYKLTEKGRALLPLLLAMTAWGDRWMDEGAGPPLTLHHKECGASIAPACTCPQCGGALTGSTIEMKRGPGWRPAGLTGQAAPA